MNFNRLETLYSEKWKKSTTKSGVEIFTYETTGSESGIMGVCEVPYNYKVIMNALSNPEIPFKANPFGDKFEIIDGPVIYMKFKGMLMVAGRDFVLSQHIATIKDRETNDTIPLLMSFSVEHPSAPEAPKGTVRAEMVST